MKVGRRVLTDSNAMMEVFRSSFDRFHWARPGEKLCRFGLCACLQRVQYKPVVRNLLLNEGQ